MEKLKIFISGTQDDMKRERAAVERAVNATTLAAGVRAETAVSQPQSPRAWIEQQIRECNIYIGVYSHRYGWVIPGENVSATEFELNLARKLGKPILVWIRKLREAENAKPDFDRQKQFLDRVSDFSTGYLRQVFQRPAELESLIAAALSETFTEIIRRGTQPLPGRFLVPFPQSPDFVGREAELRGLHEMLQQGNSPIGIRPTVLVGLGGIGKTQLAVEYAHAHRQDYPDGIFWLNAVNPLQFEFASLAGQMGLASSDISFEQAVQRAWSYLDSHSGALVIFDNVVEPSQLNVPFAMGLIPANLRCRTLFTTRQRDFPRNFQPFELKVLPEEAALRLLLRSRKEVLDEHHPEWGIARIICASLGWLPLALELSAAFLGEYREISLPDYLERLCREGKLKTVDDTHVRVEDLPTRHEIAVTATLKTQWSRLQDEAARLVFRAAGQLPEGAWIPLSRLELLTGIPAEIQPGHPSPLNEAIRKLHTVSLIEELSTDRFRLHPLVQEFAFGLSRSSFRTRLASRLYTAFRNAEQLQERIVRQDVNAVLEDVRVGLGLCPSGKTSGRMTAYLSGLEQILSKQAFRLRKMDRELQPNFMLQQLRNCSFENGFTELQRSLEAQLQAGGQPYLAEQFKTGRTKSEGHTAAVNSVAVTRDDCFIISGSEDSTIKVWDFKTGRLVRTLQGHTSSVESVLVSPDGRYLISAAQDETIRVWEFDTGQVVRLLEGHKGAIACIALTPDGRYIVSVSDDGTIIVWDFLTGRVVRTLKDDDPDNRYYGVALSAEGSLIITAEESKTLKVWNLGTGLHVCTLRGHRDVVNSVAASPDGAWLVSGSDDGDVRVWDTANGKAKLKLQGHSNWVIGVAVTPDSRYAISASRDDTLKVWDLVSGRLVHTLEGHVNAVISVTTTHDGRFAVSGSEDGSIKIWNLANGRLHRTLAGHTNHIYGIAVTPDGRYAVSVSDDDILVWSIAAGTVRRKLERSTAKAYGVGITPDGRSAVTVAEDGSIKVWRLADGRCVRSTCIGVCIQDVAVTPDGRFALVGTDDGTLVCWDIETGRTRFNVKCHKDWINRVTVIPGGQRAVTVSEDENIRVWSSKTGKLICKRDSTGSPVYDAAATPDGRYLISAHDNSMLVVWDADTLSKERVLAGHPGQANGVTVTSDGRHVISIDLAHVLKVWDFAAGKSIMTLAVDSALYSCAITPDGNIILAGDATGKLHFLKC